MKVTIKGIQTDIEAEGETQKDVFKELSKLSEVFGDEPCGVCGSNMTVFRHRIANDATGKKEYDYFERVCRGKHPQTGYECRAKLSYGQHSVGGTLFPKRKDQNGQWMKDGGWEKYVPASAQAHQ